MNNTNLTKPSKNQREMADLRILLSAYSVSDSIIAISAYATSLSHVIDRELTLGIALNQHKQLLSRVLLAFVFVFVEFVYQMHLSLIYGILRDVKRIRVAKYHKAFVALSCMLWLLLAPASARDMFTGIV